jgi:hypothetical protein
VPEVTVTEEGTTTEVLPDFNVTASPEGPSAPASVTVPVAPVPPVTEGAETVKLEMGAG